MSKYWLWQGVFSRFKHLLRELHSSDGKSASIRFVFILELFWITHKRPSDTPDLVSREVKGVNVTRIIKIKECLVIFYENWTRSKDQPISSATYDVRTKFRARHFPRTVTRQSGLKFCDRTFYHLFDINQRWQAFTCWQRKINYGNVLWDALSFCVIMMDRTNL